ncbi:MAG: hypothetical protein LBT12_05745 [Oscillospiraceae bacterium]|nr:hypothetical protein [Oscillospiraceae bacterium]
MIQPRVSVGLTDAVRTEFTRVFAGQGGLDPYGGAASDLYQNLFGTGTFTGKGILDIDAYLACLDGRFPENTVLSHDLLEGAYLRCAFAGDIELTDSFPARPAAYYARMHRWVRGDWQNLPWLFRRVTDARGEVTENPIPAIDRWKIADNLRRSLVPVFTMASLFFGMMTVNASFAAAALIAALAAISELIIASAASFFGRRRAKTRYISYVLGGFGGRLAQTMLRLTLLPFEAFICISAIVTALYRMAVSRRRLLAWVTAADAEARRKNSVRACFAIMWPCVALSAAVILFTPFAPAAAVAVVWALSPLYVYALGRERRPRRACNAEDELFLRRCAGDIWRFFNNFLTIDDNFLPPDNFQEQPAVGLAHRTSPTNVGMALLSALAAVDLGACPRERAVTLIGNMLKTVQNLPKWRGHLYNWYDTETLAVLPPSYVSTVDSGNLAGCLLVLREGLSEWGEDALAETADRLLRGMEFAPLYDAKRQLFHIGYDAASNRVTESRYDLMASEAMQASYLAVARGDVPRQHWRALSRALVSKDGYRGMASWTGTMFEYLMPFLLLPCYRDSLLYESLKFCVYVQKKNAPKGRPWGSSESAFYAFDHTLSYRYKAHGAAALALRRGMERDDVVAPYASFLALAADPRGAVANLRKLAELGAVGRYGFFDAVDFTPSRRRARDFELVRTTMAHHAGMSLVAIDNLLRGNIMQKRFLSDRRMAAFTELLQEKVPVGGIVLRRAPHETPERARRAPSASWSWETDKINTLLPRCGLLSGGAYSVVMSETGQSSSTWNTVALTRAAFEQGGRDTGVAFFLKSGGELISLLPAPMYDGDVRYSAFLSGSLCRIGAKCGGIETVVTTAVPDSDAGELRVAEISSSSEREAELVCYFEPALSRLSDYASHPAFSKLSIETSFRDGMLVLKRRPRGRGRGLFLAFACDAPFEYDTSREDAVGRGGVEALGWALTRGAGGTAGAVLDPCVLARVKLSLAPGAAARVAFALAPGTSEDDAVSAAARILNIREPGGYSRLDETARAAALTPEQMNNAMALLPELVYPSPYRRVPEEYLPALKNGQSALWNLGVSGDLPILTAEIASEADCAAARELVLTHRLFSENGVSFDLLFLLAEGGDYRSPLRGVMSELLRAAGREGALSARGGVHLAQSAAPGADTSRAVSFRVLTPGERLEPRALTENTQIPPREFSRPESRREMKYGYNDDNSFSFEVCGELPRNAWSHVLANDRFGSLATDAGTGHLWHLNARENRLNAWKNDSLATEGTEKLELLTDGEKISLFAANDGRACRVTYGFGYAVWEKQIGDTRIKTTSFVPQDAAARVLLIERADGGELDVAYYTDVALSDGAGLSVNAVSRRDGGDICVQNPYNADFEDSVFTLTASAPPERFTCSKLGYLTGKLDGTTGAGFPPCIAAVYRASGALALVTGCDGAETLRSLATLHGARAALGETTAHWRELTSRITVTTPNENLNHYINGWAAYQTLCCRVLARTSLYQSGGAYGFRDQLQDICALIDVAPETAREQILRAAERQFEEGDVQHWWHPTARSGAVCDKGVRTRCSDDLLWLPYALCEYIERTGDGSLADAAARYIASPPLSEEETERYEQPAFSAVTEPLLSHAARALDLVTARGVGRHGLCLIGGGDWNDGMNLVGAGGEGESVWLTWFMSHTASRFAELLKARGDPGGAARYARAADTCARAAGRAWDGDWYLRGYFDNGAPLGSAENAECRIDSIAQSFAALGGGEPGRVKTALKNAVEILFDREGRVVKLFDPPFSDGGSMPGYIKGYSPGFRENGGQYTHGAVWLAMGLLLAGMNAEGWALLEALLPQGRPNGVYRTEPYVLAADVYAGEGHVGRGGWTWYTGASGWFLRVAAENLLGIRQRGGKLTVNPRLPPSWDGYTARVRYGGAVYSVTVKDGTAEIREDGKTLLPAP